MLGTCANNSDRLSVTAAAAAVRSVDLCDSCRLAVVAVTGDFSAGNRHPMCRAVSRDVSRCVAIRQKCDGSNVLNTAGCFISTPVAT